MGRVERRFDAMMSEMESVTSALYSRQTTLTLRFHNRTIEHGARTLFPYRDPI